MVLTLLNMATPNLKQNCPFQNDTDFVQFEPTMKMRDGTSRGCKFSRRSGFGTEHRMKNSLDSHFLAVLGLKCMGTAAFGTSSNRHLHSQTDSSVTSSSSHQQIRWRSARRTRVLRRKRQPNQSMEQTSVRLRSGKLSFISSSRLRTQRLRTRSREAHGGHRGKTATEEPQH